MKMGSMVPRMSLIRLWPSSASGEHFAHFGGFGGLVGSLSRGIITCCGPLTQPAEPATQLATIRARVFLGFVILGSSLFVALATGAGVGDFSGCAPRTTSPVNPVGANSWRGLA